MKFFACNTGGTIGMSGKPLAPARSAEELLDGVLMPDRVSLTLDNFPLREDSTNVMHMDRVDMGRVVECNYLDHDSFAFFHGTDSEEDTCAFLSMLFKLSLQKAVFVISSQMAKDEVGNDVAMQIGNTARVARAFYRHGIVGVYAVCLGNVLHGARIKKVNDSDFNAFRTPGMFPVAQSWPHVLIHEGARRKDPVLAVQGLRLDDKFEQHVFAGMKASADNPPYVLMDTIEKGRVKGVILECKGAGNIPNRSWDIDGKSYSWIDAIKAATDKGIHVGIMSPFEDGRVNLQRYDLGRLAKEAGAISLESLTPAMADVKFRQAIAMHPNRPDRIQEFISTNIVGELLPGFEDEDEATASTS